ncbi:MAG: amidohydrolase family protein [Acidobacteria bacterium]|nr:amidohydrolase family protein [Acidobacteriota bacterium]
MTAFAGVNVIPMTAVGEVATGQTVLVRDGDIIAVGSQGQVRIPRGAEVIDGKGRFLIPGLADMHVHLEHFEDPKLLRLFPAYGVTLVRNMDGRHRILEWKEAVAAGELTGPEIITAGPILDGDPPLLPDNTVIGNAEEAREAVREQARAGYDFIKVYTNLSAGAYPAVVETAAAEGLDVAGHIPRAIELSDAEVGHRSIEHVTDYGREVEAESSPFIDRWHWSKLLVGMPIDDRKLRRAAAEVAAADVWTVPTLVQPERALADAGTLEEWLRAPEIDLLPSDAVEYWAERLSGATARMSDSDWELVRRGKSNRRAIVAALHQAGADLLTGTDTPNPFVVPGASVHEEMELLVDSGLTPAEALIAGTRAAAQFLGRSDLGTITVGSQADLVLLRQNPLENIRATREISGVMLDGRWISFEE